MLVKTGLNEESPYPSRTQKVWIAVFHNIIKNETDLDEMKT